MDTRFGLVDELITRLADRLAFTRVVGRSMPMAAPAAPVALHR